MSSPSLIKARLKPWTNHLVATIHPLSPSQIKARLKIWNDHLIVSMRSTAGKTDRKKAVVSKKRWDFFVWHIWAVLSLSVSGGLIWLNWTEYAIGGEIGGSGTGTANILGILQLAIKAHELTIVASLFVIARQWIQGNLMTLDRGIPLALLGAEKELASPSFLISRGYWQVLSHVLSMCRGTKSPLSLPRKRGSLLLLVVFLFAASVISSLAGPASGVLMIPRVDWFFDSELTNVPFREDFPYIMVPPQFSFHANEDLDPFAPRARPRNSAALDNWFSVRESQYVPAQEIGSTRLVGVEEMHVNTSTTWGRSWDGPWVGGTSAKSLMLNDVLDAQFFLFYAKDEITNVSVSAEHDNKLKLWSARKYVMDVRAMMVEVECHNKRKVECPKATARDSGEWCYTNSTDGATDYLQRSKDLLLLFKEFSPVHNSHNTVSINKVYITEGPRMKDNPEFADSVEVVLDSAILPWDGNPDSQLNKLPTSSVQVCTISVTTNIPAVAYSMDVQLNLEHVEYNEHAGNRLLFHENWLDSTYNLTDDSAYTPVTRQNITFPPRNSSKPTNNTYLSTFGELLVRGSILAATNNHNRDDPSAFEIMLSGSFLTVYSRLSQSNSQYTYTPTAAIPLPESHVLFNRDPRSIKIFNLGYGFRFSTRTSILGLTILLAHIAIVVIGSVWQLFWERKVICGWNTVPDFVALGMASEVPVVLQNTCAGVKGSDALRCLVKVGEITDQHLEIAVVGQRVTMRPVLGKFDGRYGFNRTVGKQKLE